MEQIAFPTPAQMADMLNDTASERTAIMLRPREAGCLLIAFAVSLATTPGCNDPDCDMCNTLHSLFWSISNALPQAERVAYQKSLRESGVELPPAPWEVGQIG